MVGTNPTMRCTPLLHLFPPPPESPTGLGGSSISYLPWQDTDFSWPELKLKKRFWKRPLNMPKQRTTLYLMAIGSKMHKNPWGLHIFQCMHGLTVQTSWANCLEIQDNLFAAFFGIVLAFSLIHEVFISCQTKTSMVKLGGGRMVKEMIIAFFMDILLSIPVVFFLYYLTY